MWRIVHTWSLMRSSWDVLRRDKELLVFPLLSGGACLAVVAMFMFPLSRAFSGTAGPEQFGLEELAALFLFSFCTYFVMAFFNAAIVSAALIRIRGGDPTVADGFRASWAKVVLIAEWALVSAVVGTIIRVIEGRSRRLGRAVTGLLGTAWSVGTFLVVPILVEEGMDPIGAIKESVRLLKKTWGQQVVGSFCFGLVGFLLSLPALALFAAALLAISFKADLTLPLLGCALLYLVGLALVMSALQSVFKAAVYAYAREGVIPRGFGRDLIEESFGPRS